MEFIFLYFGPQLRGDFSIPRRGVAASSSGLARINSPAKPGNYRLTKCHYFANLPNSPVAPTIRRRNTRPTRGLEPQVSRPFPPPCSADDDCVLVHLPQDRGERPWDFGCVCMSVADCALFTSSAVLRLPRTHPTNPPHIHQRCVFPRF